MQKLIIDVSEHQGALDWQALKPHIDGAIIRCGYGDDIASQDDKQWTRNVKECERLGIPYGVYLYSYANNETHIKSEIAHVLRLLKGHKPQYPVYIDLEESAYGNVAVKAADTFCAAVVHAGYVAGVYTFESFYNAYMRGYKRYTLWVAAYGANDGKPHSKPNIGTPIDAWQFTSEYHTKGYAGRLDASYFYRTWTDSKPDDSSTPTAGTAAKVLEIAASQIGVTDGAKYGKWYEANVDKDPNNYDFGGSGVPWCAMFASWTFAKAGAKCAGLPGAYCPTMLQAARDAGRVVSTSKALPGDVVYFDWDGGETDHVGIVESNHDGYLATIEGNTDNGIVARKVRSYGSVVGVVRPYYSGGAPEPSKPTKPVVFRLSTHSKGKRWLKEGREHGTKNWRIRWIAIKGCGRYRVCTKNGGWLPWVDKYDITNLDYGCAGDGSPILAVQVDNSACKYAVRIGGTWLDDMVGLHDTGGSGDTYAGDLHQPINGFRIARI